MSDDDSIVAVGLLTRRDLQALGSGFSRAFPVDQTPCFSSLLIAIDEADRALWRARDAGHQKELGPMDADPGRPAD